MPRSAQEEEDKEDKSAAIATAESLKPASAVRSPKRFTTTISGQTRSSKKPRAFHSIPKQLQFSTSIAEALKACAYLQKAEVKQQGADLRPGERRRCHNSRG